MVIAETIPHHSEKPYDFKTESLSTPQLLQNYYQILEELRTRKIIRTSNSPVGDYAEWLISSQLGLTLVANSTTGHDAVNSSGLKFQIKGRRLTPRNKSRQLSAIRNLQNQDFDFLIAVIFNEQIEVEQVMKIPHGIIENYARYSPHVNAHILVLRGNILKDPMVEDLTSQFNK
jgi:hypothetical protein